MKKIILLLLLLSSFSGYSQIQGIWAGYLRISEKDSLSLVLVVEERGDSLYFELDSPDQFSFHIETDHSSYQNDTLVFTINDLSASYTGSYSNKTDMITGIFTQFRKKFPLNLCRKDERIIPQRPQTPQPPFRYQIDDQMVYYEDGIPVVKGTLTWPAHEKPKATIILISGSGWQDRDETMYLHKPFWIIADYLTSLGYAVFRYDDLPLHKYRNATTKDFAFYAGMIVDSLKQDQRVAGSPIGLLGHSEGGLIATMCAAKSSDVKFIISLAGVSIPVHELLIYQAANAAKFAGLTGDELEKAEKMNRDFYQMIKKSTTQQKAISAIDKWYQKTISNLSEKEKEKYGFTESKLFELKQLVFNTWMYELTKTEPAKYIKQCRIPFLVLNGSLDMQVESQTNIAAFEKYIPKNPRNKFVEFPGLNHLFQEAETGNINEYSVLEQTLSPKVLQIIGEWLKE